MSLVFTLDDNDDGDQQTLSSDDEDFAMGSAEFELEDPSASGRWGLTHAAKGLTRKGSATTLDEKLSARAAELGASKPPPEAVHEDVVDVDTHERKPKKKKERETAAQAKAKSKAKEQAASEAGPAEDENLTVPEESTFAELELSKPLLKAISELGYVRPTPIQVPARTLATALSFPLPPRS